MRSERGSTLIFALAIIGLLMMLIGLLSAPGRFEVARLERHYSQVRAEYLSLAGMEQARAWASAGIVSNTTYALGEGTVAVSMSRTNGNVCLVQSDGLIKRAGGKKPIDVRTEATIPLP